MWKFFLKKGVKIPLIIIGSVLLVLILINIIAPPIAKSYVEKHSKEIVGRQINVDKVRLNIFRGKVSLMGGDSPGKNTGVGCPALLQGIFPTQGLNLGLLHYRRIRYHLSHQGSPFKDEGHTK